MASSSSSWVILISCAIMTLLIDSSTSSSSSSDQGNLDFQFKNFNENNASDFEFTENSTTHMRALQVTFDIGADSTAIVDASGQITYITPLHLWDPEYNYTASFNTSFLLNIGPTEDGSGTNASGGGMAFMLSSRKATDVPNSYGEWLGLVDGRDSTLPSKDYSFVAIEFDTFRDAIDPDNANHVGIDINSTVSLNSWRLDDYNVTLNANTSNGENSNTGVWIDYDGRAKTFDVFLANQGSGSLAEKPKVPIISQFRLELDRILPENVYFGFSASTGSMKETHSVLQWRFNSTGFPKKSKASSKTLIIGLPVGLSIALLLIASMASLYMIRRRRRSRSDLLEDLGNLSYGPRRFSYRELKKATGGFSEESKLGQGGFGAVYRGKLGSMEKEIAVKCLSRTSEQGEREFKAEIRSIGRMRHRNLVQLLGWSYDDWKGKLMLVYEYMPHGSLDRWLLSAGSSTDHTQQPFNWQRRYNVLRGIAAGLLYLHEEWEMVVIHRDLKPSNVMLDEDFNAKLGDFGLAKLVKNANEEDHATQTFFIAGTIGYMAPECLEAGAVSKESDVYSFGAVAMEIVTGKKLSAQNLHRLRKIKEEGGDFLSSEAGEENAICYSFNGSSEKKQMEMVLEICLSCCHPDPSCRPTVRQIVHALCADDGEDDEKKNPSISISMTPDNAQIYEILFPSPLTNDLSVNATSSSSFIQTAMSTPPLTGR